MKPTLPARLGALTLFSAAAASCVLLAGCRTGRFPDYPASYREYAYVADSGSNIVAVLDVAHLRSQTMLSVAPHPVALATSPTRNEVYAVSEGAGSAGQGSLAVIDAEANRVIATLSLGAGSSAVAVSPNGEWVYAANGASNNVTLVNTQDRRVVQTVGVGEGPDSLAVSSDNATLVVANARSGSVSLLALDSTGVPTVRAAFAGCPGATAVTLLPDGAKAFVACATSHRVMVLGLRTTAAQQHDHPGQPVFPDRLLTMLDVGQQPVWLTRKPDGGEIFAENAGSDSISEINTGTNEVGGANLIGAHPSYGVVSADNALLWIANQGSDSVAVYSVDDGQLINTVHIGAGPVALAFSADQHALLAADETSGDVSVIRTFSRNLRREAVYGSLFTMLPAGDRPVAIVDKAFHVGR